MDQAKLLPSDFRRLARESFETSKSMFRKNKHAGKDKEAPFEQRYTVERFWESPSKIEYEKFRVLAKRNYNESRITYKKNLGTCVSHTVEPPFALDPKDQAIAAWQKPKFTPSGKPCLSEYEYLSEAKEQYDSSRRGYMIHMGAGKKETSLLSASAKTRNPITRAEMEAGDLIGEFPQLTKDEFTRTARSNFMESRRAYLSQLSNNVC